MLAAVQRIFGTRFLVTDEVISCGCEATAVMAIADWERQSSKTCDKDLWKSFAYQN